MQNQLQKVFLVFGASGETGKRVIDYLNHWYDINRNLTKKKRLTFGFLLTFLSYSSQCEMVVCISRSPMVRSTNYIKVKELIVPDFSALQATNEGKSKNSLNIS